VCQTLGSFSNFECSEIPGGFPPLWSLGASTLICELAFQGSPSSKPLVGHVGKQGWQKGIKLVLLLSAQTGHTVRSGKVLSHTDSWTVVMEADTC